MTLKKIVGAVIGLLLTAPTMRHAGVLLAVLGGLLLSACVLHAEVPPHSSQSPHAKKPEGELRRRAMFGAQLAPVTKEVRDRQKLDGDRGVVLQKVFPDTSAADADFKAGDVILAIDGVQVAGVPTFLKKVEEARAGDVLVVDVVRDGVKLEKPVKLKEMPREKGDGYEVMYSSVTSHGARLRTIITRPKTEGRHPAVMLLQGGHTCFSVDNPVGTPFGFTWVARSLTKRGYVTMRIERPGCGDSEGGPLRDVDFDTELDGCKQALRELKKFDFVDADNVFLFGHSMGGMMAPLMAVDVPVRGIAVFGTVAGVTIEGMLGQRRRLAMLDGTNAAEVDREVLGQARFWYPLLVEKKTLLEIRKDSEPPNRVYEQWVKDDKYVYDRHYSFYHQWASKNLAEAWTKVAATRLSVGGKVPLQPRVLAIWGTSDWLADKAGNAWIAELVNRVKPGNGKFVAIDSIDHFFLRTAGPEESYRYFKPEKGMPPTEFHRPFIEALGAWLDETVAAPSSRADQASDKALFAKVDPLFAPWDNANSPGFVLGIVRDGQLIYQRNYGMANFEEGVPLAKHSVLQTWSFTKTFTTICLALLLDQGKVALDDPLSKFVPEIPDYDPPIKIRHLVQCTSGLHDYYLTMQLAGWSWRDAWTGHEVLNLLARRKSLAFKPGDRFQYSNSDFFLLGLIIERVSGQSLRRFAEEHLFAPLDMKSTFFDDNPDAVVRNRAIGYERRWLDGKYYRSMIQSNTVGATDLKTTVEDLVRWDQNFYNNRLKEGPHVNAFLKHGHLDNRQVLQAYPQETYRGLPRNWYTGGGPGFYAHMLRFPEHRFSIILLSNLAEEKEWHAMTRNIQQIADLFLADQWKVEADAASKWDTLPKAAKITVADLRDKAGLFREPGGVFQKLIVKDNQLWWSNPFQHSYPLTPLRPERFRSMLSPVRFDLELIKAKPNEPYTAKITHEDGTTALWQQVKPATPTPVQLHEYAGTFFCRDLQAMYEVTVHDGVLAVQINHGSKRPLAPMSQDVFAPANRLHADWIFTFVRGDNGGVTGFTLDWARVQGLAFSKEP